MTDITRSSEDMEMKNEMNQGTGTKLGEAQDDMQMNTEMNNDMVMNKNSP